MGSQDHLQEMKVVSLFGLTLCFVDYVPLPRIYALIYDVSELRDIAIKSLFLHACKQIDIEKNIIYNYSFLFKEYRRSIFNEYDQSHNNKV
jgi:hypothetical protein